MKKYLPVFLLVITIFAAPLAFTLCTEIGESDFFSLPGIIRYSWIMWCFIPIPILLFCVGIKLKKSSYKVVACVVIIILIILGSYKFSFSEKFKYDKEIVASTSKIVQVYIPENVKVGTEKNTDYTISYVKILDDSEKEIFIKSLSDDKWVNRLNSPIFNSIPYTPQLLMNSFDLFLFYNLTNQEYNQYPFANGMYECILIAYDKSDNRLIILSDFFIEVNL